MVFDQIKQSVNCNDLVLELGLHVTAGNMINCPDPAHADKHPSCQVNREYLYCHGCRRSWTAIDLVMEVKGWDLITAARWLADRAGVPWPEQSEEARQEYEQQLNRQTEMSKRLNCWAKNLRDQDREYLKRRGFTDDFIKQHGFGFCSQKKPQDQEAARQLGLLIDTKDGRSWYMPHGRIVIPFYQYGKPIQVAFHKPGERGGGKYLYPAGWAKPLLGVETIYKIPKPPFLVEGVFDYLSLLQAGLPALCSLGTRLSEKQREQLAKVPSFYICFDGDEPGRKAALELAKDFYPAAKIINLPDGKDLNDLLRELGQEQFKEYILQAVQKAKHYLDLVTAQLEQDPHSEEVRAEATLFVARLVSGIDRDLKIDRLAKILKPLGIGKTTIRQEVDRLRKELAAQEEEAKKEEEETQHDKLLKIAQQAELFRDEHETPFARVPVGEFKQNWPVRSRSFKMWLTGKFLEETNRGPNNEALSAALNTIAALAWKSEKQYRLHVRTAPHKDSFYYDLGDQAWRAIKVSSGCWEVDSKPPILFKRYSHMQAQVEPLPGGDPWKLFEFIHLKDEKNKLLLLVSVITDFIPDIPHVVKVFYGPGGATKTTSAKTVRAIVDPSAAPACRAYKDKKEFMQYLAHNYSCLLDNLSSISPDLSDLICSAVTGDGDSKRALYTDDDDIIYNFKRCFIINGINNVVTRPDLLRRAVLFPLEPPSPSERLEEREYWRRFEEARPWILGGIFDTLARAMQLYPDIRLTGLYDMADFTRWGVAITKAMRINPEEFLQAYRDNKAMQNEEAVSNNAVASAVMALMEERETWRGTASALLEELEKKAEEEKINIKGKGWPKAANSLSRKLNELKSTLQAAGVEIYRDRQDKRIIFLERTLDATENIVETVETVESPIKSGVTDRRYFDDIPTIQSNTVDNIVKGKGRENGPSGDIGDVDDIFSCSKENRKEKNTEIIEGSNETPASFCKYCGELIEWVKDEGGRWIPMRPDYTGFHKCKEAREEEGGLEECMVGFADDDPY